MAFGDFARLDGYDPNAAFPPGSDEDEARWAREAAAARLGNTRRQQGDGAERAERVGPAIMGGLADLSRAILDPIVKEATDYSRDRVAAGPMTEAEAWRLNNPNIGRVVPEMAMLRAPLRNPLGPVSQAELRGGQIFGGIADPRMFHGISSVKLSKPISEMAAGWKATGLPAEKIISPEALHGGVLLPAPGDRAQAGVRLVKVGDQTLEIPTDLLGGHGFMPANTNKGHVWASDQGVISTLAGRAQRLGDKFERPVYLPYTAMGERSVDFSHHMSDTLAEMLKDAKILKTSKNPRLGTATTFNETMRNPLGKDYPIAYGDFPGVLAPNLRDWLIEAPGKARDKFAKIMDTGRYQASGFPNIAEARYAVTDPRLLHVPTGAAGLSISRVNPGRIEPSTHRTYNTAIGGDYLGGFGQSIPKEIMYPDIYKAYGKRTSNPSQQDYLFRAGSDPFYQLTDDKWLEGVMRYLERTPR